ncbi:ABC transporter substrate-binding protein [Paenibacillus hemerocallicola]|uniref:ABC transporter substrate-binding protein n=1 Tax=Paenibacillus hemerocallicola TaxID=1172614 RepID=UPI00159EC237|nr:ABC transporter substrate-binding protein [Paenibacillus hemerocallicola]
MQRLTKAIALLCAVVIMGSLLAACGAKSEAPKSEAGENKAAASAPKETAPAQPATRVIKDAKGRDVTIPTKPQRIVSHYFPAETAALGVKAVGTNYATATQILSKEQLEGVEDIGGQGVNPNLEKILSLNPDLILVPDFLEPNGVEALSKIAPTVVVSYTVDLFTRLRTLGDITGKTKEAEEWIAKYNKKAQEKRDQLKPYVKPGETATAFVLFQDKKLYVYGNQRLGSTMYDALGFVRPEKATKLFESNKDALWQTISEETLPDYAGDRIFIVVNDSNPDVKKAAEQFLGSPVWKNLPAVKNGKAYVVGNKWSFYDPITLDWLLDEMPKLLMK